MDRAIVIHHTCPAGRRTIAVRTTHGNLPFFRALMDKIALTPEDILVLVGDILEKGPESLALLRHVMALCRTHTVYPLCGNCDGLVYRFFQGDELDRRFFSFYLPQHPESTLRQLAREGGFDQTEDLPRLRSFFNYSGSRICDTTPGTVFIWRDLYETEWAICDDSLYFKVQYPSLGETFTLPLGGGRTEHFREIARYCCEKGIPLSFYPVPKDELPRLQEYFPNSAAVADPSLIDAVAAKYGSQFVTVAIDARRIDGRWRVTTHGGRRLTDRELFAWAEEACRRGAGEILFTSMDHDGTRNGYPCDTFAQLSLLPVPVIASGGAGSVQHIADVLTLGRADAALAASIFHYGEIPIPVLKRELRARNIPVRL